MDLHFFWLPVGLPGCAGHDCTGWSAGCGLEMSPRFRTEGCVLFGGGACEV
jgi:hypothetical protein